MRSQLKNEREMECYATDLILSFWSLSLAHTLSLALSLSLGLSLSLSLSLSFSHYFFPSLEGNRVIKNCQLALERGRKSISVTQNELQCL